VEIAAVLVGAAHHLGASAHWVFGQSHPLGQVRLEHEPERALGADLVDLAAHWARSEASPTLSSNTSN